MHAEIRTIQDPLLRVKIVEERISFDQTPQIWFDKYEKEQLEIQQRIENAQKSLDKVQMNKDFQLKDKNEHFRNFLRAMEGLLKLNCIVDLDCLYYQDHESYMVVIYKIFSLQEFVEKKCIFQLTIYSSRN